MESQNKQTENLALIEDGSIDAGLLALSVLFPDGCPYSHEQIAFICGCHRSNIWSIEKNAIKKLKKNFAEKGFLTAAKLV